MKHTTWTESVSETWITGKFHILGDVSLNSASLIQKLSGRGTVCACQAEGISGVEVQTNYHDADFKGNVIWAPLI